jgi:hypothetical protein
VFLPVSNLLVLSGTIMAERLMYLPLMFIVPVVVGAALTVTGSAGSQRIVAGTFAVLVVVLGVRTSARNRDWHDDLSIWSATVQSAPQSFKSHSGLANALYQADPARTNLDRVVAEKDASLAILATVPNPAETPMPYYEAAVYHTEYADRLKGTGAAADAARSYERAAALVERYLVLARPPAVDDAQLARARLLQSTLYTRLARGGEAVDPARA